MKLPEQQQGEWMQPNPLILCSPHPFLRVNLAGVEEALKLLTLLVDAICTADPATTAATCWTVRCSDVGGTNTNMSDLLENLPLLARRAVKTATHQAGFIVAPSLADGGFGVVLGK